MQNLRPLTTGELLDRTFQIYRRHFLLFFGICAIPQALLLAFISIPSLFLAKLDAAPMVVVTGLTMFIGLFAYLLMYCLSLSASTVALSAIYLGRSITISEAFGALRGSYRRLTNVVIGVGLLIGIGFLLLVVPGIYLSLIWSLALPAAVLENLDFSQATNRSSQLTADYRGRAFVIYLLYMGITYAVLFGLMIPAGIYAEATGTNLEGNIMFDIIANLVQFGVNALVMPISSIAFGLFYYDMRIRKEAFDLQYMMATMGPQQAAAAAAQAPNNPFPQA